MADLAVIIVSYNSRDWLRLCLSAVYEHAGAIDLDVVVVDNGSSDGSAEFVEQHFPRARVLRRSNRGFAAGNNEGLRTVDAPFALLLNPDAVIVDGTLAELVGALRARPEVAVVGCRQLTLAGDLYPSMRRFPSALRLLCEMLGSERWPFRASWLGERELDMSAYDHERRCDWTSGSFMLARMEALREVGFFDERYFMYCEEPDLCLQLAAAGWAVRHLPTMTIEHPWDREGVDARLAAQEAFARRQYMEKHFPAPERVAGILALALGLGLRGLLGGRNEAARRERRRASRAALRTLLGISPPPFAAMSGRRGGNRSAS